MTHAVSEWYVSEWYVEALRQLEADLKLGLDETNCPWLNQEECVVQSIEMVLRESACPDFCSNCSKPYCHCINCGQSGVLLSSEGQCGDCLRRELGEI